MLSFFRHYLTQYSLKHFGRLYSTVKRTPKLDIDFLFSAKLRLQRKEKTAAIRLFYIFSSGEIDAQRGGKRAQKKRGIFNSISIHSKETGQRANLILV